MVHDPRHTDLEAWLTTGKAINMSTMLGEHYSWPPALREHREETPSRLLGDTPEWAVPLSKDKII